MRPTSFCFVAAIVASAAYPDAGLARSFSFGFDFYRSGGERYDGFGRMKADIDDLDGDLYYTGQDWDLIVRYKVEIKNAPVGQCELVLDVVDRDLPSAPIRLTLPLDRPTKFDDDEVIYSARTSTRIALEHVRDPGRLRLYGYVVPVGGGPVLDRESTKIKHRR